MNFTSGSYQGLSGLSGTEFPYYRLVCILCEIGEFISMNKLTLIVLTSMFFISSCGIGKPIPQPLPSPSQNWSVKLTQSGGFAGVQLTVEVSSNGQLKAGDQRSQQSVNQKLPIETITKLKSLVFSNSISRDLNPQSACADCFIYDVDILSDGKNVHIHVDDVTISGSGAQDLIRTLIKLRDDALKPNP
jgi:hypothetical protein